MLAAYDRHDAGNAAADKLATELLEAGIECFRVLFPKAMDANDYARKVQPPDKSLGLLLRQVEWLGKGSRPGVTTAVTETPPSAARKEVPPGVSAAPMPPTLAVACAPEQPEPAPLLAEGHPYGDASGATGTQRQESNYVRRRRDRHGGRSGDRAR
ncbi:toprim domain-containing protein [Burkholderia ubonensis]|uniref:toprim domain-containing protein n=1 Tax=Burkholderia ubonensis TaxID=101571 RepID=UPI0008FE5A3C|nr:toprim domain-containing protein [Burkholderia ubonensis]